MGSPSTAIGSQQKMLHKHQNEWESIIIKPNISSLPFSVKSASHMGVGGQVVSVKRVTWGIMNIVWISRYRIQTFPLKGLFFSKYLSWSLVAQPCLTLCDPLDCSQLVPLSMGFFTQEHWSGTLTLWHSPGNLPNPGIRPLSLVSPAL